MLRAVQEIKPKYVIAENVFGITNIDGGLVFEQVCLDLEAEGYEVQPYIIPAAAKNAPHRRDRVWFIGVRNATNTDGTPTQCRDSKAEKGWENKRGRVKSLGFDMEWEKFPTQPPICGGDDGLSPKLDGITFSKWRAESIKGYGNAIVPQVAFELFKIICNIEK